MQMMAQSKCNPIFSAYTISMIILYIEQVNEDTSKPNHTLQLLALALAHVISHE